MNLNNKKKSMVLVVDDNPENLKLLTQLLNTDGHSVRPALNGKIALAAAQKIQPDLILLDIMMPEMDGFETARHLKAMPETRDIPIIFLSALAAVENVTKGFEQGAVDYIVKPFNEKEVLMRVKRQVELKQMQDALKRLNLIQEAVFTSIPDTIVAVSKDFEFLFSNKQVDSICPWMSEPDKFADAHIMADKPCYKILSHTLATQEPIRERQVQCNCPDGNERIIVLNALPLSDPDRSTPGAVLVMRDITRLIRLEQKLHEQHQFKNIIGKNKSMQKIYELLQHLADLEINVLIAGESGAGKELIAEALHYGSSRAEGPLIKVNCAALSGSLLESELFGHVRGAFTGAIKDRIGRIEAAQKGTLFLDEIGDIDLAVQAKLLRFLEQKEYERVGESRTLKADVRVLSATNQDLKQKMEQGLFRADLYYRLRGITIDLPPLRCRKEDIPLLCRHFLSDFESHYKRRIEGISEEVMRLLLNYNWPGNVRELRQTIEHAYILCKDRRILPEHLPADILEPDGSFRNMAYQGNLQTSSNIRPSITRKKVRDDQYKISKAQLLRVLGKNRWNKVATARELGIGRSSLYRYLEKYNI